MRLWTALIGGVDRGAERAERQRFTMETDIAVYVRDPGGGNRLAQQERGPN